MSLQESSYLCDTFESNSNRMTIALLCTYFKISYLWNDKKRIALRMKATFLDFIREVPISSLVTTGMEERGVKKKKGVEEKAMRRTEGRKVEVLESGSTLENTKCGAIGAVATCEPTSLERFTILAR